MNTASGKGLLLIGYDGCQIVCGSVRRCAVERAIRGGGGPGHCSLAPAARARPYAKSFVDNAIDLDVLSIISDNDLEKIGILLGHRRRILRAIADDPNLSVRSDSRATAEAERRYLTVLFCDLVDSTRLSTRLDPEAMRDIVRAFQDTCAGSVARYDGFVAQFLGDGVLVYFGYPRAHEGDAERAVRAALEISTALERHSAPDGTPLRVRIGIATGLVVVGDLVGQGAAQNGLWSGMPPTWLPDCSNWLNRAGL
jgi:Adenylate and Guanylate cyclase catalytic domain/SAM domain (Sterile alpha motif)